MKYNFRIDAKEAIRLYEQGFSCEKVWKILWASRQAIWEMLKNRKVEMRTKTVLPYIMYDWVKFTPSKYGYYRATQRDKNVSLHRYMYLKEVWEIPEWYEIHHIDWNKQNNKLSNLVCISKAEHSRLHQVEKFNAWVPLFWKENTKHARIKKTPTSA